MAFIRDLFTGELKEIPGGPGGRQIIYRSPEAKRERRRFADPWDRGRDHISRPLSLLPEQATPERVAAENEAARYHGTGAYFTPDGLCHLPTRGSRSKEMARPHGPLGFRYQDNDAGYSDYAGR